MGRYRSALIVSSLWRKRATVLCGVLTDMGAGDLHHRDFRRRRSGLHRRGLAGHPSSTRPCRTSSTTSTAVLRLPGTLGAGVVLLVKGRDVADRQRPWRTLERIRNYRNRFEPGALLFEGISAGAGRQTAASWVYSSRNNILQQRSAAFVTVDRAKC